MEEFFNFTPTLFEIGSKSNGNSKTSEGEYYQAASNQPDKLMVIQKKMLIKEIK